MTHDRLTALRLLSCYWLTIIVPSNGLALNVVYNKDPSSSASIHSSSSAFHQSGRKFGGYRIVPRACKDATGDTSYKNDVGGGGGGVCMFNFECAQLGGSVVGSCVDVFLFGACCRLPAGTKVSTIEHGGPTTPATVTSGHPYDVHPQSLSFQQPVADTILLHRNGTVVQNAYRPDDMSADLLTNFTAAVMHANRWQPPPPSTGDTADVVHHQYTASSSGGHHHDNRRPPFASVDRITSKVDYGDSWPSTTVKHTSPSSSPASKSTDSVPNIRKTTPSAAAVHSTTSKHVYGYEDSMVLIPTLTANDANVKTPVENNSIHHILSILKHTPSTSDDEHDDPMDSSSSYHHYAQTNSPSSSSSPALYTWGSIEGNTKTPGYGSSSTFPVTRPASAAVHSSYYPQTQHYDRPATSNTNYYGSTPSAITATSTHHLLGPHFHVLSTTAKPAEPVAPTVIVLSSANDVKNPNKYSSTTTAAVYGSSSYRPSVPSHVKPSQSIIVTGKPSVSAAYTTTAAHHQYQPPSQQPFVPVTSTPLADKYYNSVSHTSAKPPTSSSKPAADTAAHHDNGGNNNVFTTVITSVNHQYHNNNNNNNNKYQPTVASTYSTAKPVLNHGSSAAVAVLSSSSSSTGGYGPHVQQSAADDDYPLPVVTQPTQVFITASDVHHHHHLHAPPPPLSYPAAGGVYDNDNDDEAVAGGAVPFNSTDTFAFPPVRDPNVNMTAAASQQEKPDAVVVAGAGPGDYDADADPHPQLTADDNLDDKVHLFVEKVVQSLQGNFEDLEKVLLSGDPSTSNVTVANDDAAPNKKPTTTKKPPPKQPAAAKPTKPPTAAKPVSSTYRPTPITPPADAPYLTSTARPPTKVPTLLTPVQLFQPTTYTGRPPTKQPVKVTAGTTTVVLDTLNVEHGHITTTAEPDYRKVCGVRPLVRKNGRIVGGTGSTFGEWPWQVLVREATWLGLFTKNKCGGVLITQKHVITAAHCQPGFLANLVAVFGEYDISGEVESKRSISKNVKRVIVHRQYDAGTFENDIALLELESPVSYDMHIVPICMPDDDDDFTGRMASVTGWGRLKYGGGVPSVLQEVQVPIIENQVCQDMFETAGHTKTILNSFLCAGYANGQRDSCEGDSGGPLMIEKDNGRWTLIGTVSHGIKCAAPYLPGVYMRTTYYKPWLQTITGVQ